MRSAVILYFNIDIVSRCVLLAVLFKVSVWGKAKD